MVVLVSVLLIGSADQEINNNKKLCSNNRTDHLQSLRMQWSYEVTALDE